MLNIPVTIVDNFFEEPEKVVDFAASCEFKKSEDGRWPGKRSEKLYLINKELHCFSGMKLMSLFYSDIDKMSWNMESNFQIVDTNYFGGWVHTDYDSVITGIIYLNKNPDLNSGTSIYKIRKNKLFASLKHQDKKFDSYLTENLKEAEVYRKEHNEQFEETIKVSNVYNRLVCFDSHLFHAAQDFQNNLEPRLSLVMFLGNISNWDTPIKRMKTFG
jgi:hypothetical protein